MHAWPLLGPLLVQVLRAEYGKRGMMLLVGYEHALLLAMAAITLLVSDMPEEVKVGKGRMYVCS